jgi:protein phosphatase methylesterase 1
MHKKVLQSTLPSKYLPPTVPKNSGTAPANRSAGKRRRRDYTPASWNEYFEKRQLVEVNGDQFCVYSSGNDGPVLLLLHGGGHSALSWAVMSKILLEQCNCRVMAFDARGHGRKSFGKEKNAFLGYCCCILSCITWFRTSLICFCVFR